MEEKRTEERVSATLPIQVGTATGITRDVSASGMFFVTDTPHNLGSQVILEVALDTPGGRILLKARGSVVRVERRDEGAGVAVKFVESTMGTT